MTLLFVAVLLAPARPGPSTTIPITVLRTRHIAARVWLNGFGPYRFVLDTGAPISIMSSRVAEEIGFAKWAREHPMSFTSMENSYGVESFRLENLPHDLVYFTIMDHPVVDYVARADGRLDGIVGLDILSRYRFTLDYRAKSATFVPSKYRLGDLQTKAMERLFGERKAADVLAPAGLWGIRTAESDGQPGVLVASVVPESAAHDAGLVSGDRILEVAGRWLDTPTELYEKAAAIKIGNSASLLILRGTDKITLHIRPRPGL